jgi:hypothetical protein
MENPLTPSPHTGRSSPNASCCIHKTVQDFVQEFDMVGNQPGEIDGTSSEARVPVLRSRRNRICFHIYLQWCTARILQILAIFHQSFTIVNNTAVRTAEPQETIPSDGIHSLTGIQSRELSRSESNSFQLTPRLLAPGSRTSFKSINLDT